jgi:AbrB family looped-hinge helix DNA binding protein
MATATVNAKGQVTIPVQVRATLGLRPGDEIEFFDLENGQFAVCVRPSHLPSPATPRHGVHLNLTGHQF